EVKSREGVVEADRKQAADTLKRADEQHQAAIAAERTGDTAKAEEARESERYLRAVAEAATANADTAERDLDESRVTLAQRQHDFDVAKQDIRQFDSQRASTEKQLDAMENKARMLDEAGLKLQLASTIDNPVERADLELAAQKLLQDANDINVDTNLINTATGQDVQIPDVNALPAPDATVPTDATSDAGGAGDASDVAAAGHLQDEFATVAAGSDGSADPTAAAADGTGAAGAGDALGASPDLAAAPDALGVDGATQTADAAFAPGADEAGAAAGDVDAGTASDGSFDQPAPADELADAGTVGADSFNDFSGDPGVDDAGVAATDDVDA